MISFIAIYLISGIVCTAYFFLILYQSWRTLRQKENDEFQAKDFGISLLIPFKDESIRIETLLRNINSLEGNQSNFEVIFINDCSKDDTASKITELVTVNHRIVTTDGEGKKAAIHKGVETSVYDVIVTLDADVSIEKGWLKNVRDFFSNKKNDFLILPVLIDRAKGLWGSFESLDVLSLTGTTLSWAKSGNPILCNGANMGFRKKLFRQFRLKAADLELASGDDIFFMHQVKASDKISVGYLENKEVIAHTRAFNDIGLLVNQRSRWASKARYYKDRTTSVVTWIVLLMYLVVVFLGIVSFFWPTLINLFLIVLGSKVFVDFFFLVLLALKFDKVKTLWFYPLAVLIQFVFVPVVFIKSQWGAFEWKGRNYKR